MALPGNPGGGINWNQPNGPRQRPSTGRNRNTLGNAKSGGAPRTQPFQLGPASMANYGSQAANLRLQYAMQTKSLNFEKTMARAMFQQARGSAYDEATAATSDVAGSMAERGIVGSTVQTAENQGVLGARDAAVREAKLARQVALGTADMSKLQALIDMRMGLGSLALQKAAEKREMALAAFGSAGQNPWGFATSTGG